MKKLPNRPRQAGKHVQKNKEQHEGVCEEEKAQRGASVTTDHSKPSWPDTQLLLERASLKENHFFSFKVSCRKERGKTENSCYDVTEKLASRACNTSMFPLDTYQ